MSVSFYTSIEVATTHEREKDKVELSANCNGNSSSLRRVHGQSLLIGLKANVDIMPAQRFFIFNVTLSL